MDQKDIISRFAKDGKRKPLASTPSEVNPDERTTVHKISTWALDRDLELVDPAGIDLSHFRDNPVVLANHDQDKPVGKALWIKPDGNGLVMKTKYPRRPDDLHESTPFKPDEIFALVSCEPSILNGASIGFMPLEIRDPTPEEREKFPGVQRVIAKCLLMEVSLVAVPCNQEALLQAVTKGLISFKKIGQVRARAKAAPVTKASPARATIDTVAIAKRIADRYFGRL
jgi:phage head maturation protease